MPSNQTRKPTDPKKYSWLAVLVAVVVLAANAFLTNQGTPLPEEIADTAEAVLDGAAPTPSATVQAIAEVSPTDSPTAPNQPNAAATATPAPIVAVTATVVFFNPAADFDYYVLALSWEPAFCESAPNNIECASQTESRFDASHFVLHGLWPSNNNGPSNSLDYCNVPQDQIRLDQAGHWCELPALPLSTDLAQKLTELMPGSQSCLQNHEWYKHGTCAGISAEAYYDLSSRLVQSFAQTEFNRYIAANVGQTVDRRAVLDQFAAEFGPGTEAYLSLRCERMAGLEILTEIQITLKPDLSSLTDWPDLFPPNPPRISGSCPRTFHIDAVG